MTSGSPSSLCTGGICRKLFSSTCRWGGGTVHVDGRRGGGYAGGACAGGACVR